MEKIESENLIKGTEDVERYEKIREELLTWLPGQDPKNLYSDLIKAGMEEGKLTNEPLEIFARFKEGKITMEEFIDARDEYVRGVEGKLVKQEKSEKERNEELEKDSGIVLLNLLSNKFNTVEDTLERLKRGN
ncbi:MAG: hypothetical protein WC297_00905 [Candidatus Paceibacterota bacterium]|jgi:hypothetical protein